MLPPLIAEIAKEQQQDIMVKDYFLTATPDYSPEDVNYLEAFMHDKKL